MGVYPGRQKKKRNAVPVKREPCSSAIQGSKSNYTSATFINVGLHENCELLAYGMDSLFDLCNCKQLVAQAAEF
jgi:hypothetical protein